MMTVERRRTWIFAAIATVAVAVVFSPLVRAPYLFDDHTVIESDGAVVEAEMLDGEGTRSVSLWQDLWLKPRPLRQLTHRIDRRLFGPGAACPHAVNILLHLAVAGAGWFLLTRRLGVPSGTAWAAAAVFLFNPVVVESVGIVSHRKEMLGALFTLFGLCAALSDASRFSWRAAALLAVAAAGKETSLVFPALFAICAEMIRPDEGASSQGVSEKAADNGKGITHPLRALSARRPWIAPFAAYCAVAAVLAAVFWLQIHEGMDFAGGNPGETEARAGHFTAGVGWATATSAAIRAFPRNVLLLALPFGHAPDPAFEMDVPLFAPETLASLVAIAAAFAMLAILAARRVRIAFPLLWPMAAMVPYLYPGLLRSGATAALADRYLYLASFGFAWAAADLLAQLPRRLSAAAIAVIAATFAAESFALGRNYVDEAEYWNYAAKRNPKSVLAAHNHAWGLWKEHEDFAGASAEFRRMMRLNRNFDYGTCSFAQMHAEEGDFESGLELLDAALRRNPRSLHLHRQRALLGTIDGDDDVQALSHFKKAEALGAKDAAFQFGYATLLRRLLRWPEAAERYALAGQSPAFAREAADAWTLLRDPRRLMPGGLAVIGDSVPHGTGTAAEDGATFGLAAAVATTSGNAGPATRDFSVPGSLTTDLDAQLEKVEAEDAFGTVAILSGHNDAFAGASSYEILLNIAETAAECRRLGMVPVVIGPIHVRDDAERKRNHQEKVLTALDSKMAKFCRTAGIRYISARQALGENDPAKPSGANYDPATGNHLSRRGVERLAQAVLGFPAGMRLK